jgi:hypothetical protein
MKKLLGKNERYKISVERVSLLAQKQRSWKIGKKRVLKILILRMQPSVLVLGEVEEEDENC